MVVQEKAHQNIPLENTSENKRKVVLNVLRETVRFGGNQSHGLKTLIFTSGLYTNYII